MHYCRRPRVPISLQRDTKPWNCFHNGSIHSFESLSMNNISINTILHKWKSSQDKVEEYSRYLDQLVKSNDSNNYLCECTYRGSFGKNCEYLLPTGTTFADISPAKFDNMYDAGIVCYTTLQCNFGLLCLDWREICDGIQNCMSGYDEENCDKIEFNECENDEYRCMNGMCIPDEYFLDGDHDCMDMSDEKEHFDGIKCPQQLADVQCDDRICPPNEWSCGDGQCIKNRLAFQKSSSYNSQCISQRDQFYLCETKFKESLWTLPNGQCSKAKKYEEPKIDDYCAYLFRCVLSSAAEKNCPCGENKLSCVKLLNDTCSSSVRIQYPNGGIIAPYMFHYYNYKFVYSRLNSSFIKLNGTIKCRGYVVNFIEIEKDLSTFDLRNIEAILCASVPNKSNLEYHQFCYNDSLTFNNYSYNFIDVCKTSNECISAYRINDGIENCANKTDEQQNQLVSKSCLNLQRYRFRCSIEQPTCLYANTLGDLQSDCKNKYDESWMGAEPLLSNINCNSQSKTDCHFLRRYIEASWNFNQNNDSSLEYSSAEQIPFRAYCDTFWDLSSKEDENIDKCRSSWICRQEQWRCNTGQCISSAWVLDGEWDCPDASDEENIVFVNVNKSHHNYERIKDKKFQKNFTEKYRQESFGNICNLINEYPCFPINMTYYSLNYTRPCIDLKLIGDGRVDCIGGYDERSFIPHCDRFSVLGYDFKCLSTETCITHSDICINRCSNHLDDDLWCKVYENNEEYSKSINFKCFNGTNIDKERCNGKYDCPYGEDEYMCNRGISSDVTIYRQQKRHYVRTAQQKLQLPRFPNDTNSREIFRNDETKVANISNTINSTTVLSDIVLTNSSIPIWCNRGVSILMSDSTAVCFCPPPYHGDQCQYHSDRITVFLHLNLTQSIYAKSNDKSIVIKLLVLFLFENQVLATDEFHVRPALEIFFYKKKKTYLQYSRSPKFIEMKQNRYFNRSDIIIEHPYSVRIEAYEMKLDEKSRRFAVWQYPIYFDFLPVFRLAKVLHLTEPNTDDYNPCKSNPCNQNQECYQLLNEKSQHICLCKNNFSGLTCSELHPMCNNNYCSSKALCQPDYRALLNNSKLPYCICPYNYIGKRCELLPESCSPNPCKNGGTCFQRSAADEFKCECTKQYDGLKCEQEKHSVRLSINKSNTIEYDGIVLQYFNINFLKLELLLVNQSVFTKLPDYLLYIYSKTIAPEIILLKFYIFNQVEIYLISLHIDVISINRTTSISEQNRCVHVQLLFSSTEKISLFKYHNLCRNNHSLFCFLDGIYICICNKKKTSAECFRYDNQLDHCRRCHANGRCLKGREDEYHCICPPCHSGRNCQFNFESFSFTLDQLFFNDLLSTNRIVQQLTFYLLIITPCILFLLGLVNNIFCFITFRRPKCLQNGIGQYSVYMSIINQLNLNILMIRLIHLTVNIANPYSYPLVDNLLCKISNYLLNSSTRITYCLSSLIAIERIYVVLFLNGQWLKKPHIARRLILFTIITILTTSAYELVFIQSQISSDDGYNAICVLNFPSNYPFWKVLHKVVTIMNALIPFLINLCCTIVIICVVTKKKMNANVRAIHKPWVIIARINELDTSIKDVNELAIKKSDIINEETTDVNMSEIQLSPLIPRSRFRLLIDVLIENKELVVAPTFTLIPQIFSLPFFIASFSLQCQNFHGNRLRYLLIVSYFTTFIPQLTSFFLYISPSSFYSKEWSSTNIGKWIARFKQTHQTILPTTKTSHIDGN